MKIYDPGYIELVKVQIINPEFDEKFYVTFEGCTLKECVKEMESMILDSDIDDDTSKKTQIVCREYVSAKRATKGSGETSKNGKCESVSTKKMTPLSAYHFIKQRFK